MKRTAVSVFVTAFLLISAHRLPAPISEVPEGQTPAPKQSVKSKSKTNKPKSKSTDNEASSKRSTPASAKPVVTGSRSGPALNAAAVRYAAIAFSPSTGRWGYGNGFPTQSEAIAGALRACGQPDAKTNWCRNAWIALAISDESEGGWGSSWGETLEIARSKAISECRSRNPDARVVLCVSAYR